MQKEEEVCPLEPMVSMLQQGLIFGGGGVGGGVVEVTTQDPDG